MDNGSNAPTPLPQGDSFSYALDRPISHDGKKISTLTLRRPLVRDLIAAERQPGEVASSAALLAACAGIAFTTFALLDAADYRGLTREAEQRGFFDPDETPAAGS